MYYKYYIYICVYIYIYIYKLYEVTLLNKILPILRVSSYINASSLLVTWFLNKIFGIPMNIDPALVLYIC